MKIEAVALVLGVILIGVFVYLFMLDKKISKIEKEINNKK